MKKVIRVKTSSGRIIPVLENQLEEYLKAGCVELKDEEVLADSVIQPPKIEDTLICPICGYQATTKKGLRMHKLRKHGLKD